VLSIITGGGKWVEMTIPADPLYQHLLLAAEKKFWPQEFDPLISTVRTASIFARGGSTLRGNGRSPSPVWRLPEKGRQTRP
jgi:hypothetical protein